MLRDLGTSSGSPPLPLTLTIDRQLQLAASQALAEAFTVADDNWGSREVSTGAAAVVLDASDGSILALASFPAYEPDIFNPDTFCCGFISAGARIAELVNDPRRPLRNRATQEQYPPGSVYKIMTTAASPRPASWPPTSFTLRPHLGRRSLRRYRRLRAPGLAPHRRP